MTTPMEEGLSVPTPEEEQAARKDALKTLYDETPGLTPLIPLDKLLVIEEHIHDSLVKRTIAEQIQYLDGMEDGNPALRNLVGDEPLIAWLVRIAKGEINFPNPN